MYYPKSFDNVKIFFSKSLSSRGEGGSPGHFFVFDIMTIFIKKDINKTLKNNQRYIYL